MIESITGSMTALMCIAVFVMTVLTKHSEKKRIFAIKRNTMLRRRCRHLTVQLDKANFENGVLREQLKNIQGSHNGDALKDSIRKVVL